MSQPFGKVLDQGKFDNAADDRSSETYHSKWDKFAADEAAALKAEDAELAAKSNAALGREGVLL
jgi:hypothetical protein